MKSDNDYVASGQSPKPRRGRNREVSSRFLSPNSATSLESGIASPRDGLSPIRRKHGSNSMDTLKHRSLEDPDFIGGHQLWPSTSSATSSVKKNLGTLAEHLGNDRLREYLDRKADEKSSKTCYKENNQPSVGRSMRHTGKFDFSEKSSSSSVKPNSNDSDIIQGRLSLDENVLHRKSLSSQRNSNSFTNTLDSESNYSDAFSSTEFSPPTIGSSSSTSRKLGIEVPSKYMNYKSTRARRGTSDSNISKPLSSGDSSILKKITIKNAIKRANSLTGYRSSKSQWALSPGRSKSPPISVESREKTSSFLSLKPSTSTSKVKSVDKFLNLGFDLFKSKNSSLNMSPMGFGASEVVHQLRLFNNRLIQWRYANARAESVNGSISDQAQINLLDAWDSIIKLRHSVVQKKIKYGKERLEMKLNFILYSQTKLLEAWGNMERQHLSAVTVTKESLHSVVCRVPIIEGAEVNIQSASIALRHASDLTPSLKSILCSFSVSADKTAVLLSELAEVVAQEKLLLEEFYDLFHTISILEVQERSLKCCLMQLDCWQQQYQQRRCLREIIL